MFLPRSLDHNSFHASRRISVLAAIGMLAAIASFSFAQMPFNTGPSQGRQIDLRTQLTTGLKAFTKADFAFIDTVVKAVEDKRLPRTLVDTTFLWAREKAKRRGYRRSLRPFVYFRPGLTARARAIGVKL